MINYQKTYSDSKPQDIEITDAMVFIAKNIKQYSKVIDGHEVNGYEYDYYAYTKDEYIQLLTTSNAQAITELQEELAAAKILLGVE